MKKFYFLITALIAGGSFLYAQEQATTTPTYQYFGQKSATALNVTSEAGFRTLVNPNSEEDAEFGINLKDVTYQGKKKLIYEYDLVDYTKNGEITLDLNWGKNALVNPEVELTLTMANLGDGLGENITISFVDGENTLKSVDAKVGSIINETFDYTGTFNPAKIKLVLTPKADAEEETATFSISSINVNATAQGMFDASVVDGKITASEGNLLVVDQLDKNSDYILNITLEGSADAYLIPAGTSMKQVIDYPSSFELISNFPAGESFAVINTGDKEYQVALLSKGNVFTVSNLSTNKIDHAQTALTCIVDKFDGTTWKSVTNAATFEVTAGEDNEVVVAAPLGYKFTDVNVHSTVAKAISFGDTQATIDMEGVTRIDFTINTYGDFTEENVFPVVLGGFQAEYGENYIVPNGDKYKASKVRFTYGTKYDAAYDIDADEVAFPRTFTNNKWSGLVLPYDLTVSTLDKRNFDVAKLAGASKKVDEKGQLVSLSLVWTRLSGNDVVAAGKAYLISVKGEMWQFNSKYGKDENGNALETPVYNAKLGFKAEDDPFMETIPVLSFGSQDPRNVEKWDLGNGTTVALYATFDKKTFGEDHLSYYGLSKNATFIHPANGASIQPFRVYLKVESSSQAMPEMIENIVVDEGFDMSGIDFVEFNEDNRVDAPVYDIMGRKVANPTSGLYIQNGKKFIIK